MKSIVVIDGSEAPVEIVSDGKGAHTVRLDGVAHRAEIVECEPGVYSILVDGRSFEAALEANDAIWIGPDRTQLELRDPRRWSGGQGAAASGGLRKLKAAMPGKVVRTLVAPGDQVETGQALLVVEAMKMQNEVKSPKAGVVRSLEVKQGDSVAAGDALVVVD